MPHLSLPRRLAIMLSITVLMSASLLGILGSTPARADLSGGGTLSIVASGLSQLGSTGLRGVCEDASGNIIFANRTLGRIYALTQASGFQTVVTIAGVGQSGTLVAGNATSSPMTAPSGLACLSDGSILFSANSQIGRLTPSGSSFLLSVVAGSGGSGSVVNGGLASAAPLGALIGIAVAPSGVIYTVDSTLNQVYSLTPSWNGYVLNIIAGTGTAGTPTAGPSRSSAMNSPTDIEILPSGALVVSDSNNNYVELLALVEGSWRTSIVANVPTPRGLAVDSSGNLYVVLTPGNIVMEFFALSPSSFASSPFPVVGNGTAGMSQSGSATATSLRGPRFISFTATGHLLIGDTGNAAIEKVAPSPTVPGLPSVTVAPVTESGSLTFNWSVSDNGGSDILSYQWSSACSGSGNVTSVTCTGLTGGETYALYVTATNANGVSGGSTASAMAVSTPSAPVDVSVTSGVGSLDVSWSAPNNNGGAPVTSYTATATDLFGNFSTCAAGPGMSSNWTACSIDGLSNGSSYAVTVTAANSIGSSGASQSVTATTPNTPGAPTTVSATSNASTQSVVSWTAPSSDGGSAITAYVVSYSGNGGQSWQNATTTVTSSPFSVTGLTNGTSYRFRVAATNAVGTGSFSGPGASGTPATTPGLPRQVVVNSGIGQLEVSWTAPVDNGGTTVTGYRATATDANGTSVSCSTDVNVNISPTTCTISGLVNGTSYVVEVVAINEVGSSTPATSDAIVTTTVPSAPTPVSLVPGNRTITVSWSAPSNNGGTEVTSYVATATDGNGTSFTCTTEAGLSSTCTISGLAVGTTYDVTIQARNVVGTSATARSGSTTTFTAPSAPVIVSSVGGPNRVVLTWSAPLQSGGLLVTSYTASDGQGHSCTTSTTSCTIRGLVNGRHYTFSVTATSAVGTSAARSFVSVAPLGANISTRVAGFAQFSSTVTPSMFNQIARTALSISLTGRKSVTIRGYGNLGTSKSLQLARATSAREALTTALQVLGVNDISIVVRTGEATNTFGNGSPQANRCVVISTN